MRSVIISSVYCHINGWRTLFLPNQQQAVEGAHRGGAPAGDIQFDAMVTQSYNRQVLRDATNIAKWMMVFFTEVTKSYSGERFSGDQ